MWFITWSGMHMMLTNLCLLVSSTSNSGLSMVSLRHFNCYCCCCCCFLKNFNCFFSLLAQDVVLTSIQRHLNVMDVRWTLKQRCVLTGRTLCISNFFLTLRKQNWETYSYVRQSRGTNRHAMCLPFPARRCSLHRRSIRRNLCLARQHLPKSHSGP